MERKMKEEEGEEVFSLRPCAPLNEVFSHFLLDYRNWTYNIPLESS